MKAILALALVSSLSFANPNSVSVTVDGKIYQCLGEGGSGEKNCTQNVTDYCTAKTTMTSTDCFKKSSNACKYARGGFYVCVRDTTDYCTSKTSITATDCFNGSLQNCQGQ